MGVDAKAVAKFAAEPEDGRSEIVVHQDAFAGGYDDNEYTDEYTLLGMAVKY